LKSVSATRSLAGHSLVFQFVVVAVVLAAVGCGVGGAIDP